MPEQPTVLILKLLATIRAAAAVRTKETLEMHWLLSGTENRLQSD